MYINTILTNIIFTNCFLAVEDGGGEVKEKPVVEEKKEVEEDEIDPLDAYMQEVQQVCYLLE